LVLQIASVQPGGPSIHRRISSGLVSASNTRAAGPGKLLVINMSRAAQRRQGEAAHDPPTKEVISVVPPLAHANLLLKQVALST